MSVRLPGLLLPDLTETRRLRPTAGSLTVKMIGSSEASITMPEDEAADVRIRDWVSIYDEDGFAGIFRVTNVAQPLKKQVDLTLLHGIDILSDSVWSAQTEFEGTKTQFLTQLLAQQTQLINGVKPWVLGVCEDTATVKRDINYDRLSALLEGLNEEGGNYWFTYDMTGFPWVLNYVHVDNTVVSEFRLTRNIRSATITYNDADMCTRLFLTVSTKTEETVPTKKLNPDYVSDEDTPDVPRIITENITVSSVDSRIKEYNNTTAQEDWGIVVKTADIDTTDDILNGHFESADAWAAAFLARRSAPSVQIQIDGDDLFDLTGDVWDRTKVGRLCQVALPAYGKAFRERVVSVTYPELFKKDEIPRTSHVTVSLSNILPRFTESLAKAEKEAATASRSSRATARAQTRDEKELTTWSKHVQWQGAALDGSGIMTLYESGIDMDATGGVRIYSLENGLQGLYGELKVQSKLIEGKVGSDALNGYLRIQDLSTEIGNVMITPDGQTIAASVVTAINQSTGDGIIYLNSDRVILKDGSIITATTLDARLANVDDLFTNTGYSGTITSGVVKVITGLDIYNLSSDTYKRFSAKGIYIGNTKLDMEFLGNDAHSASLTIPNAVTGFGTAGTDQTTGEVTIPFYTYDNPSTNPAAGNKINFNIANTVFYQNHVGISNLSVTGGTDQGSQQDYSDSSAQVVTVVADGYYIVAADAKDGTHEYKKFHVPAASQTSASIDNLSGSGIATNVLLSTVQITASGTNVSNYSENVVLDKTTYQVGSASNNCVTLSIDNTVIGRISTQSVYIDGRDSVTVNQPTCGESTVAVSDNAIRTTINIKATASNNASNNKNFTLERNTYNSGVHCVNLKEGSTVIGRISTETVYTAGQQSVSPTSATISNSTANASTGKREATLTVYYKGPDTTEDSEPLSGVDVTSIYNAGKAAGTQQSSYPVTFTVTFSDGHTGNVTADCANIWNQGADDAAPPVTVYFVYRSSGDLINAYSTAKMLPSSSDIIGKLYPNTIVNFIRYETVSDGPMSTQYAQCEYYGMTFYILASNMHSGTTPDSPTNYPNMTGWYSGQAVTYDYTGVVSFDTGNYVNIYSSQSTSSSSVTTVPNEASVQCMYNPNGYSGEWMPVKYGNYTGYMEAKYIYGTQAWYNEHPSVPVLQAIAIEWIVHSTDSYSEDVMLTVDPAIGNSTTEESSVVPQSAYQAITVDSSANKSDYLDYVKNYFYASYTQLSGMPDTIDHKIRLRLTYSNSNTPSYINLAITSKGELVYQYPTTVYADTGSTVRIRSGPSASSSTVTNVPIGSTIYCLDQPSGYQGDWIRVKYGTYEGYMMAKYVVGTDAYEDAYGGGGTEPSDKEIAGVAILGIVHKSSGTTGDPGNWAVVLNHRYPGSGSQTSSASDSYDSYGSGAKTGSVGTYFGQIPYTNYYAQHSSSSCSHGVWHKAILSVSYTDSGAPERVLIEFYSTAT